MLDPMDTHYNHADENNSESIRHNCVIMHSLVSDDNSIEKKVL